jgi:hypothetical protein
VRAFIHILVDELHGHWSASFSGLPHVGYGGAWPADAVRRLIDAIGSPDLDTENIITIDAAIRDGHLEFLVPYRCRWRHPVAVSLN